jgi:hypothetical protein
MRKMGHGVIPLFLRDISSSGDIYREPGFGFEIMLKRPCFAGFPSWWLFSLWPMPRIFFDGEHIFGQEGRP